MHRARFVFLGFVLCVLGCSSGSGDLSQERSPSATGPKVSSSGPAKMRASMDKLQGVGKGDGIVLMGSK